MGVDYSATMIYGYDLEDENMPEPFKDEVYDDDYGIYQYRDNMILHSLYEDLDFIGITVSETSSYGINSHTTDELLKRQGEAISKWEKFRRDDEGLTKEFKEWSKENPPKFLMYVRIY